MNNLLFGLNKFSIIKKFHIIIIILLILFIVHLYYSFEIDRSYIDNRFPWFERLIFFEFGHHVNGILLYIPFIYAILVFNWRGALFFWIPSLILIIPHIVYYFSEWPFLLFNFLVIIFPLLVFLVISLQLKLKEIERRRYKEREADRQNYISQILKAQEDERKRLARELHDDTTQTLLAIANDAQATVIDEGERLDPHVRSRIEDLKDTILQVSGELRRISLDLRPSVLDDVGLAPATKWLVDRLNKETGIKTTLRISGSNRHLSSDIEINIFRFVQEAINNVKRHSEANLVTVNLDFGLEIFKVSVEDNGRGFDIPEVIGKYAVDGKLGIVGMEERAKLIGGTFNIKSRKGKGTIVSIETKIS